ncbi:MAG: glycosyltransferase, partial [Planctomycetota bacterium]
LIEREQPAAVVCPAGSPLEERARAAGVTVHGMPLRGELNPAAVARIRRLLRRGKHEILQMHTSHAHTIGVLARGLRRRPRTIVNRRVDFSVHRSGTPGFTRLKYRFGVDRYIAVSEAIRAILIEDGIDRARIEVVRSGVGPLPAPAMSRHEIRVSLGIPRDALVIGNVAHLAGHKGQIHLLRAMARLRGRFPGARAVIVGEGPARPLLEGEVRAQGLEGICVLTGFREDIPAHLAAFDIFVMPSEMEGLCTSILDALLAGLPVVASRTGGIPEIIADGETGLLAAPGDPGDLARAIAALIEEPERARALARRGRERVESEFSVEAMVKGTLAVYARLLGYNRAAAPAIGPPEGEGAGEDGKATAR